MMSAKPTLGASPSGGGLTFGSPSSAPPFGAPASTMPTFGAPGSTGQMFGAPASTGTTFGTPNATGSTFGMGGTGFSFGSTPATTAPTAPTGGLNFGLAQPNISFNLPTSSAPSLGGFNFGGGMAAPTSVPGAPGFSFGGLSAPATSAPAFGLGTNFGKPATSDPTKPITLGLGGVDNVGGSSMGTLGLPGGAATSTGQATPAPKTMLLPAELITTVDTFKTNVRQRKQISSEIARCSIRPLNKVQSDADALLRELTELSAALAARRRTANSLRSRAGGALPAAERAHRIAENPHGIDYESADVVAWIVEVVAEGESRLVLLRRQLEAAQRQLEASHKPVTDEELALGMRRIHESFIAVAGRLQAVHQQVEMQKSQYLSLRRNILKDPTDVFAKRSETKNDHVFKEDWFTKSTKIDAPPNSVVSDPLIALGLSQSGRSNSTTGPNPFTNLGPIGFSSLPFGFNKSQTMATQSTMPLGNPSWGSSLQSGMMSGTQSFGSFTGLTSTEQSPFALQKPPAGNKRGKY